MKKSARDVNPGTTGCMTPESTCARACSPGSSALCPYSPPRSPLGWRSPCLVDVVRWWSGFSWRTGSLTAPWPEQQRLPEAGFKLNRQRPPAGGRRPGELLLSWTDRCTQMCWSFMVICYFSEWSQPPAVLIWILYGAPERPGLPHLNIKYNEMKKKKLEEKNKDWDFHN